MRVLLAFDGSAGATQAVELAESIAWPPHTTLRIVSVVAPRVLVESLPRPLAVGTGSALEAELVTYLEMQQVEMVDRLAARDRQVEAVVLRGRPATAIIEDAVAFSADVLVVGSRGHGRIASLVLGSVSAEVVDHAPCPVLVVRRATLSQLLLATDGSPSARIAEDIVGGWPIFDRLPIRVVSVADVVRPLTSGIAPLMHRQVIDASAKDLDAAIGVSERIAQESATRLRHAGHPTETEVRPGDAAAEIISVADERQADLVVLGSRGRTGLTRILLGSVARNVLAGSGASVLIVRNTPGD